MLAHLTAKIGATFQLLNLLDNAELWLKKPLSIYRRHALQDQTLTKS